MKQLTTRDLRALLEFIRESYEICDVDTFAHRIISRLPKIVPSEITTYNEINPRKRWIKDLREPSNVPFPDMRIFRSHMHEHPVIAHHQKTRDNRAFTISDFITRRQFHRRGLYNEFYRLLGVEDQIAFGFPTPPPLTVGIALNRGRNFTEHDRLLLNVLSPHLIQAYRNAEVVTEMQQKLALASQVLDTLDRGAIVLTKKGRIRLMSTQAQKWLRNYFDSRSLRANRLPESLQRWLSHQEILLAAKDDVPPPQNPLVVEREAKRLVVRHLCDQAQCLLLFEEQLMTLQPFSLEPLGLSHREAEVLAWVAQGKTNIEIGTILGMSPRTVQKHLEHIFGKLGVETRTAAAAKAYEVASVTSR